MSKQYWIVVNRIIADLKIENLTLNQLESHAVAFANAGEEKHDSRFSEVADYLWSQIDARRAA